MSKSTEVVRAEVALMEAKALDYTPLSDEEFSFQVADAKRRLEADWSVMIDSYTNAMNTIQPVIRRLQDENERLRREAIYWRTLARRMQDQDAPRGEGRDE